MVRHALNFSRRRLTALFAAGSMLTAGLSISTAAQAEGEIRIAEQFGIVYLLLNVAREQELAGNPNARIVLNSYQVLGGPASATVLYATEKYRKENPKTYKAFVDALAEAAQFTTANPEKAADIFLRVSNSKIDRDSLIKIIKNPDVQFKITPQNTLGMATFMNRVGAIKNKPVSAKDYFFDDPHNAAAK